MNLLGGDVAQPAKKGKLVAKANRVNAKAEDVAATPAKEAKPAAAKKAAAEKPAAKASKSTKSKA